MVRGVVSSSHLDELAGRARPVTPAGERVLPVVPAFEPLLPHAGLRRGSVVNVTGSTSLALALVAGASTAGFWCAAAATSAASAGLLAAAELGVDLERFPVVAVPSVGSRPGTFPWVVAALLDAFDVVLVSPPCHVRATETRRLASRARERGSVVVVVGHRWPEPVHLRLAVTGAVWRGVGRGHGRLEARQLEVTAVGRGVAARERRVRLWLPSPEGGVAPVTDGGSRSALRTQGGEAGCGQEAAG